MTHPIFLPALLNHTRCFEAAAFDMPTCDRQCGSSASMLSRNQQLAAALEDDNQELAFAEMDSICTYVLSTDMFAAFPRQILIHYIITNGFLTFWGYCGMLFVLQRSENTRNLIDEVYLS
jgi:hypothetical protein